MSETGFDKQISKTLGFEGGYVEDSDATGNESNFGITRRQYPDIEILSLTRSDAIAIYRRDVWRKLGLGTLDDAIGGKVFDLAVMMGAPSAIKLLQRAVNRLQPFDHIDIDGWLGGQTVAAAGDHVPELLLQALRSEASNHYLDIVRAHPVMRPQLGTWLKRAVA